MHNIISQEISFEAYRLGQWARQNPEKSAVRVTSDLQSALTLYQDVEFFLGEEAKGRLLFFPPYDHPPLGGIEPSPDITAERVATLWRLLQPDPYLLVVLESEISQKIIPPDVLKNRQRRLVLQESYDRENLVGWLLERGYRREGVVESPGDFALRGAIIDIYPPQEAFPLRLEWDGDQIADIRFFDPATQTTLKGHDKVLLLPASDLSSDAKAATLRDYLKPEVHFFSPEFPPSLWSSEKLKREWSMEQLKKWRGEKFTIRLVCHTPIQAGRLKDMLRDQGIETLTVEVGKLSNGFGLPNEGLILLTEEEIFGHKTIRHAPPFRKGVPQYTFGELQTGDHLVHEEHGICRYQGLQHLKIGQTLGDYLHLEFLGGDKLYLPIYRLNVVQKYVGGQASPPLDSLRGTRWKKVKAKARREVFKIAAELLKIHAQRKLYPGNAFPPPDTLDEEFASHFPYEETPDQAQAIEDVLRDMQKETPMDRLVCGDVGYGKTEVAMRAAFKAVSAGKQAALLVPTTILALQHYETFLERFDKLAISVAMFSRFCSKKEQKDTVEGLSRGKLDIVIGTHRLLKEDVRFKDLGLLMIDEEHRFGVRHKEKIKKLRPTVDVLTLSATPIPRTLHMSLLGLRDLSMIHTPPADRIAIRTFLAKWEDSLVRHAVHQELLRGGQVFFVHNRVATIPSMFKRLRVLFPEAAIAVAHGQMRERDLERVMIAFLHQKIQILLTTAIIESGIDIPNANTILINRADTFGLAQLYQLRGRVGRSDCQAYCYLLVPDEGAITAEAKRRLLVLTRFAELGAGFQIASHDLEIRGAGNLLGTSQAGFIEEIGYELYTKLLARTLRQLKGEAVEEEIDPEIQIGVPAVIPESYVADPNLRMALYKRMSHLTSKEEVLSMEEELLDRFGPLPEPVKNLLSILELKQRAVKLRIPSLKAKTLEEAKNLLKERANDAMDKGR